MPETELLFVVCFWYTAELLDRVRRRLPRNRYCRVVCHFNCIVYDNIFYMLKKDENSALIH